MNTTCICVGLTEGSSLSCRVEVTGKGLEIYKEQDVVCVMAYHGMRIGLCGMDNRYFSFQNTCDGRKVTLMASDEDIIRQVAKIGAPGDIVRQLQEVKKKRDRRISGGRLAAIVFAVLVIGIGFFAWFGFGILEGKAVSSIPTEWEVELGRSTLKSVLKDRRLCRDPAIDRGIQEIGMRLVGALGGSPYRFHIKVITSRDVNGFALPGGYIVLTSGLLEQAKTGEEVAGVVAHEMQHVLKRHGLRNIARRAGLRLLVSALFGDMGALEQLFVASGEEILSMSFSREQEEEADRLGIELMGNAKIDRMGLPNFLESMEREERGSDTPKIFTFLSTHPASRERVKILNRIIQKNPAPETMPLKANWSTLKNSCSSAADKPQSLH